MFWLDMEEAEGSEPGFRRPCVVVQNDAANRSLLGTTIVCFLTSNLKYAYANGNVLLDTSEAGLPKQSVVNVSQIHTVAKSLLTEYIGSLTPERVRRVVGGIERFLTPTQDVGDGAV